MSEQDGFPGLQEPFVPRTIHLNVILDVSPSMVTRWGQTLSGLNEYFDSLRKDQADNEQPYKVTMTTFSADVAVPYKDVELDSIPTFTNKNLQPYGWGTALYDAIGPTVEAINTADPVLVVIVTDGEENSSRKWDESRVAKLMDERQAMGNYTYAYLGVAKEAWGNAARMGNSVMRSASNIDAKDYGASTYSVGERSLAAMTCSYSATMRSNSLHKSPSMSVENFFNQAAPAPEPDKETTVGE